MRMRDLRRRYKTWWWMELRRDLRPRGTHVVLADEEAGHDEHNCWTEYLIARWK
jgi:hypothetical protein